MFVRCPGFCVEQIIVASGTTPYNTNIHSAHRGVFANTSDLKPHAQAHYTSKCAYIYRHFHLDRDGFCHANLQTAVGYTNEHAKSNSDANGNAFSVAYYYGSANGNTNRHSGRFRVTPW